MLIHENLLNNVPSWLRERIPICYQSIALIQARATMVSTLPDKHTISYCIYFCFPNEPAFNQHPHVSDNKKTLQVPLIADGYDLKKSGCPLIAEGTLSEEAAEF